MAQAGRLVMDAILWQLQDLQPLMTSQEVAMEMLLSMRDISVLA